MKTKVIYSLIIVSLILTSASYAANAFPDKVCHEEANKLYCADGNVENLNYVGDLELNNVTGANVRVVGDLAATKSTCNNLTVVGDMRAQNVKINNSMRLTGDLSGELLEVKNETKVTGDVSGEKFNFQGLAKIVGDLKLKDSYFENDLVLSALSAELTHSKTQKILFTPTDKPQVLTLKNSIVDGSITFSSNNGIVYSDDKSVISGEVKGGQLNKK
jgi:hypothetical protein